MTEPLIVVEGNLRLPTLRALTDPSLNFGFEWSATRTRPVQTQTEYSLFAARFETAYVPALSLSDARSPYRAANLWAVFAKEEIPRAMLRLIQDPQARSADDDERADPIHLAVGAPAIARKHGFSKPVAAAIAAAGGVLIVWMLFGLEPGSTRNARPASAEHVAMRAQPDAVAPASAPAVLAAATASIPDQPANVEPISDVPTPPTTPLASAEPETRTVTDTATPPPEPAPIATMPKQSSPRLVAATATAARTHTGRVTTVLAPRAKPPAPIRAHAPDERVAKQDATRHARVTSVKTQAHRTSKTGAPLDPMTLYSMLQHSPTLDSNAAPSGRAAENGAR
ncbi:hypothetical protein AWB80_07267 [Caballeronia pedi]|uniref:Uncharacterized protein n=1 Tax=Caballeronia pedi TaxID=1777141 RepID=A0A158DR29_9BURK|nr:hypothetical protein [Caballeronia pedi]SAK96880.1 hypothetical protein AWB80_07267 [Caballeronia pedi]